MILDTTGNRYRELAERLSSAGITLVAVSKTRSETDIMTVYDTGCRDFGENRVQEVVEKEKNLPKDIRWHMIGYLQRNKVKYIAPFVHLIHSVTGFDLLKEINKQAKKNDRVIDCLLQIHIAEEATKHGLTFEEVKEILFSQETAELVHIRIVGLMGMATFTSDEEKVRSEFSTIQHFFNEITAAGTVHNAILTELSIGMSDDYEIASECGSTMVRVGTGIFGLRARH